MDTVRSAGVSHPNDPRPALEATRSITPHGALVTELLLTRIQPLELVTVNQYTDPTSESFETLLLKAHPETALIHELGSRLRTLPLPIADWDDLVGKLQDGPVPELLQVPE